MLNQNQYIYAVYGSWIFIAAVFCCEIFSFLFQPEKLIEFRRLILARVRLLGWFIRYTETKEKYLNLLNIREMRKIGLWCAG